MARVPYEDEIIISWVELHRDARFLSEQLHRLGPWKGIIAVTRGGLVPAALVARELDIRLVDTICVTSYDSSEAGAAAQVQSGVKVLKGVGGDGEGYLLIDDLVDTGRTAQAVRQLLPKAHFACLYAKPAGRPIVDTFVKEFKQTKWIHFPWDIEYSFATPIKDGGRTITGPSRHAAHHPQPELLGLVAAAIARHAGVLLRLRREEDPAGREGHQGRVPRAFAGRQGADPGRRQDHGMGFALHSGVPGGTQPQALAGGSGRARPGALARGRDARGVPEPAQPHEHEHAQALRRQGAHAGGARRDRAPQ